MFKVLKKYRFFALALNRIHLGGVGFYSWTEVRHVT